AWTSPAPCRRGSWCAPPGSGSSTSPLVFPARSAACERTATEEVLVMSKVFSAHAVSADGYITGRDPGPGRGLGDGSMLFDWYFDGDTPSEVFGGFRLSAPSARVFDALAARVGAIVAGRN